MPQNLYAMALSRVTTSVYSERLKWNPWRFSWLSQRIGAVAVLVNTMLEKDDLECVLRLSDVRVLCVGSFFGHDRAQLVPKLENLPCLERVCAYSETPSPLFPLLLTGAEPDAAAVAAMEAEVTPDDTAVIIFTSGSTGAPQGSHDEPLLPR